MYIYWLHLEFVLWAKQPWFSDVLIAYELKDVTRTRYIYIDHYYRYPS